MPLRQFKCGICGRATPKEMLRHGKMKQRMEWLRKHYKKYHPARFKKAWG